MFKADIYSRWDTERKIHIERDYLTDCGGNINGHMATGYRLTIDGASLELRDDDAEELAACLLSHVPVSLADIGTHIDSDTVERFLLKYTVIGARS